MTKSILPVVLILSTLALAACDGSVTDYVRGTRPSNIPDPLADTSKGQSTGPTALQVSSGNETMSGGGISMRATIGTTQRPLEMGSDRTAVISINRTRSQ